MRKVTASKVAFISTPLLPLLVVVFLTEFFVVVFTDVRGEINAEPVGSGEDLGIVFQVWNSFISGTK